MTVTKPTRRSRATSVNPDTVEALAKVFVARLKRYLTSEQYRAMKERNVSHRAAGVANVCASHDFVDANEVMAEAFYAVTGRKPSHDRAADTALWNDAWALADRTDLSKAPRTPMRELGTLTYQESNEAWVAATVTRADGVILARLSLPCLGYPHDRAGAMRRAEVIADALFAYNEGGVK